MGNNRAILAIQIPEKMKQKELKSMLKQIGRLAIALTISVLIGITNALPAHANTAIDPTFDPASVRLGITPTGWSNSDDLTIDLDPPISAKQIMSEIALSGFKGTQGAPKFPGDVNVLKKDLETRGLTISEPWVGTFFTIGAAQESYDILQQQIEFMDNFDSDIIVVAELGGAVHQQPIDPIANRPILTDAQWKLLTDGLNELGKRANAAGKVLCYHPHVGTGVATVADIDRLMENTDPAYVHLLLDTGHISYAMAREDSAVGIFAEPLEVAKKYKDRIKHVHMKNIREDKLTNAVSSGESFLNAIRSGVFTVPGDLATGAIDFEPILQELANVNYKGWLMVEAEQDPNTTMADYGMEPLEYALMAREYLRDVTGL
jgi:inosose dehydratase